MKAAVTTLGSPASPAARAHIDPGVFVGDWTTTNQQTQGLPG